MNILYGGIKELNKKPGAVFSSISSMNINAVREGQQIGVPIAAISTPMRPQPGDIPNTGERRCNQDNSVGSRLCSAAIQTGKAQVSKSLLTRPTKRLPNPKKSQKVKIG